MPPIPPITPLEELVQQVSSLTGLPAVASACCLAVVLVAARDWRLVLAAFAGLTVSLGLLAVTVLPPEWALLRIIVGGLVAVMWYLSAQRAGWGGQFLPFEISGALRGVKARPLSSLTAFRTLAALALAIALLAARPRLPLPPLPADIRLVATWLALFSLLGLGLGEESLQTGVALLMWLGATQLVLGALRQDAWLIWLLSTLELLVGLATAYLMVARGPVAKQPPREGSG